MTKLSVKIKLLDPKAKMPFKKHEADAGWDLFAVSKEYDSEKDLIVMNTGVAMEIPPQHVGLVFPRSSIINTKLMLKNAVGVIDSSFRGSIKFFFDPGSRPAKNYEVGDRIGQIIIMPYPEVEFVQVDELSQSDRGAGGFGSTGL